MKSKSYDEFVEKFKPKLTTDDCYTPQEVYDVIQKWVCNRYGIDRRQIVRPFWPGADYQTTEYHNGCVVLDNPPFSILSKICEWYLDRDIKFFLFAPSLTALSGKNVCMRMNHIIADADIIYHNGAIVRTAFVTNLDDDILIESAPDLGKAVKDICNQIRKRNVKEVPKYEYPVNVITAARMQYLAAHGVAFRVRRNDCVRVSKLDAQKSFGKAIFGGGLLLSDRAAAERAAAERAAAERAAAERADVCVWELSDREREIIKQLGGE